MSAADHLKRIRAAELGCVRKHFAPGMRVLELGGGDGYQASIIHGWGCEVFAIDVPSRRRREPRYHPVIDYDGAHLPFADGTFDCVFSSNVLEHIAHRTQILAELRRVLKPGGRYVHIVPSATWRLWTSLAHYPAGMKMLLRNRTEPASPSSAPTRPSWRHVLFAPVHGEYGGVMQELRQYRRSLWCKLLARSGFIAPHAHGNRLFYTGYGLVPQLPMRARRILARVLGSSCHVISGSKTECIR